MTELGRQWLLRTEHQKTQLNRQIQADTQLIATLTRRAGRNPVALEEVQKIREQLRLKRARLKTLQEQITWWNT